MAPLVYLELSIARFSYIQALLTSMVLRMHDDGGVITAYSSFINIIESVFSYNTAKVLGGVIHAIDTSINIRETTFDHNRAGNFGGTLHLSHSTVDILDSDFTNSRASDGGVLHTRSTRTRISEGSNFNCNIADSHGGVILIIGGSLEDSGSTFANNSAQGGGVMNLSVCDVTLMESTLDTNIARKGGAILAYSSTLHLIYITSSNNKATINGGVVNVADTQLNIHWCYFTGNTAKFGAIINAFYSSVYTSTSHFSDNNALNGVLETTRCNVELHSLTITNNSAKFTGLYTYQSTVNFTGSTAIKKQCRITVHI